MGSCNSENKLTCHLLCPKQHGSILLTLLLPELEHISPPSRLQEAGSPRAPGGDNALGSIEKKSSKVGGAGRHPGVCPQLLLLERVLCTGTSLFDVSKAGTGHGGGTSRGWGGRKVAEPLGRDFGFLRTDQEAWSNNTSCQRSLHRSQVHGEHLESPALPKYSREQTLRPKGDRFCTPKRIHQHLHQEHPHFPSPGGTRTTRGACSEPHGAQSVHAQTESQLFSSRNSAQIKHRTNTWTASQQHSCSSFPSCTPPLNSEDHLLVW